MKKLGINYILLIMLSALLPTGSSAEPSSMDLMNQASAELGGYQQALRGTPKNKPVMECSFGYGDSPESAMARAEKSVRIRFSQLIGGSQIGAWILVIRGEEQITENSKSMNKTLNSGSQEETPGKYLPPIQYDKISLTKNVSADNIESYVAGICGSADPKQVKAAEFKFFYEEALSAWEKAFTANDRVTIMRLGTTLEAFLKNTPIFRQFPDSIKVFNKNLLFPLRNKLVQIKRLSGGSPRIILSGCPERVINVKKHILANFPKADIAVVYSSKITQDAFVISPYAEIRSLASGIRENFSNKKAEIEALPELVNDDLKIFLSEEKDFRYYFNKLKAFWMGKEESAVVPTKVVEKPDAINPEKQIAIRQMVAARGTGSKPGPAAVYVIVQPGQSALSIALGSHQTLSSFLSRNSKVTDPDRLQAYTRVRVK
ncbi:MAG: hypothetical protein Q7R35_14525 [Elusimicrobiota bacterium]|nr:hypothetical protein [Elusimicrobiota bacterium]